MLKQWKLGKVFLIAGLVSVLALMVTSFALAGSASISSTINSSDSHLVRYPFLSCFAQSTDVSSSAFFYKVYPVQVDTTGTYTADRTSAALNYGYALEWYSGPFDTNNPLVNCHDAATVLNTNAATLTAGQLYYLIIFNGVNGQFGAYTVSITGPGNVTIGSPTCKGGYLNCDFGDEYVRILNHSDSNGNPALQFWCVDTTGKGSLGGVITQADLNNVPAKPATNTLAKTINCRVPVTFWVLTTGSIPDQHRAEREGQHRRADLQRAACDQCQGHPAGCRSLNSTHIKGARTA